MPIKFLQELITYPTITPKECGIYEHILKKLDVLTQNKTYQSLLIRQENKDVKNLFYALMPKNMEAKTLHHICFAGHVDVVPTGEGWEYDPFSGIANGGYIYGRGAQDMKGGISAFICALYKVFNNPSFIDSLIESQCMVSILLTSDEEGEAIYGTKVMLGELQKRDLLPHVCIVAEPTSVQSTGDMIKIGRRGSINGILTITGQQGHVAYPEKCINPVELLGDKLGLLAGVDLDKGNEHFAPSKLVITDIRAGMETTNVTPQSLKIMFNVRNSPLSNADTIRAYINTIFNSVPYELTLKISSSPFITEKDNNLIKILNESIKRTTHITPKLSTSGGTSDARFFAQFGVDVIEIGLPNDRIHAINECVLADDIIALYNIFIDFLHSYIENAKKQMNNKEK